MIVNKCIVIYKQGLLEAAQHAVSKHDLSRIEFAFLLNAEAEKVIDEECEKWLGDTLVISLGGDGTFVTGARIAKKIKAFLVGFHAGTLGFLASWHPEKDTQYLSQIINAVEYCGSDQLQALTARDIVADLNRGWMESNPLWDISQRHMITYWGREGHILQKPQAHAMNEFLISHQAAGTILTYELFVGAASFDRYHDGHEHLSYTGWHKADGLILASATGSTAYALSVGGALMDPEKSRTMQIAPIAPASLTSRPLIVSDRGDELIKVVVSVKGSEEAPVLVKGDGLIIDTITETVDLVFGVSITPVYVVQPKGQSWYTTLTEKLHWNVDNAYRKEK